MDFLLLCMRRLHLVLLIAIGALIVSCAVPGGSAGGAATRSGAGTASPPTRPIHTLFVSELRGRAWVQRDGRAYSLQKGSDVAENQPVQVGAGSTLLMQLGEHSKYELAANSRMVVHQLPRQGRGDTRATWLRLEQGYLRIQWTGAAADPPMQVSFGIWAARLRPGDYVFDTRGRVSAVCAMSGSMRMSGVPEWTPEGPMQDCTRLEANRSPMAIRMNDAQWSVVRTQRRLLPTLAQATRNRSSAAIARLEREHVRSPAPRPPAPEPAPARTTAPVVATVPRTPIPAAPRRPDMPAPRTNDDLARERTAEELIREAESVHSAARANPPPRTPDPMLSAPAPSVGLGPSRPAKPLPPLPALSPRPAPIAPPPPPPPPEPVYEEPPRYAQHVPPVIVIPDEPAPPPARTYEPAPVVVVEPPRTQHVPPVIVIPDEPEPAPIPPPPPPPAPPPPPVVAMAPTPPAAAVITPIPPPPSIAIRPVAPPPPVMAAPLPPAEEALIPTPHTPPVIVVPAEPEPQSAIAPPPPPPPAPEMPPPVARAEPPVSAIELAAQSPVVVPPPSQPPPTEPAYRARGNAPPTVPLNVAMYSVAAMPDKVEVSESALIVPPTISHEPARSQWLVNIASYPNLEPAQEHARALISQKLRAGVREQALPERMSYLVVIEGFATEEAAETAAVELEAQFDLDPY